MQRCSKKAYARCPYRHLCGPIEEAVFADDSDCAKFNREVEDKPMTNSDRFRAMSDDEMAVFLLSPADICGQCQGNGEFCTGYPSNNDCRCVNAVKKWLQQPAEECDDAE